jgi:hypothetical protein
MSNPIAKMEKHVTVLPREVDDSLLKALGHLVVACGRLEDMFKIAIKRIEQNPNLEEVLKELSGKALGELIQECRVRCPRLEKLCEEGSRLNKHRKDFIHATFAADEEGGYVRFRKLVGYDSLEKDIATLETATKDINTLIENLDRATGSLATSLPKPDSVVAIFSVPPLRSR